MGAFAELEALFRRFPTVEEVLLDAQSDLLYQPLTTQRCIEVLDAEFRRLGPFEFARKHNQLRAHSGATIALDWMCFINELNPGSY